MILSLAYLSALLFTAASALDTHSAAGAKLMAKARYLAGGNNNNNQGVDYSWVQNYSIRFQKCASVTQFNTMNNNGLWPALNKANVAIFKLCPTKDCSAKCTGGEYIVSTADFANYYTDNLMNYHQYTCETIRKNCVCDDYHDDNVCQSDCYKAQNATYCVNMQNNNFNIQNYMECGKIKFQNQNQNNNNNNGQNNQQQQQQNQYYAAPKCSSDGSKIIMGLFTDQYCTLDADSSVYSLFASNYGFELPHSSTDLVEENCVSCNYGNGNGQYQVSDMCSSLYLMSAKCETNLQGQITYPTTSGCAFLNELPTKTDGYVAPKQHQGATIFFALTTFSLLALLVYVSYKAGIVRKKIDLGARDGTMA